MSKYTKKYFIEKFSKIPSGKICTDMLMLKPGIHCALGWCRVSSLHELTPEAKAIEKLLYGETADINNGHNPRYQQPTPKARILAALRDLP